MEQLKVWPVVLCFMFTFCLFCDGKAKTKSLSALTFNTWLVESSRRPFAGKEARKARIIKSLKRSNADVVCLQEVYIGRDLEDIVNGVKKQYPYSFSELHTDVNKFPKQATKNTEPPCNKTLLDAYTTCLDTANCNSTDVKQNAACLILNCIAPSLALFENEDQKCITCMSNSLLNLDECSNNGSVVGGRQVNNGGLLLLSKKKPSKASYTDFHPTTKEAITRGYIKAVIKDYATVMCTQLSRVVKNTFVEPELLEKGVTSYAEMNTLETNEIIKRLKGVKRVILMGDMNMGPKFKSGQIAKIPSNYKKLAKQFKTKPMKGYTFKNPKDEANQSVLDHIFVRGISIKSTKRVFVPKNDENPLSNHVGVLSMLRLKK